MASRNATRPIRADNVTSLHRQLCDLWSEPLPMRELSRRVPVPVDLVRIWARPGMDAGLGRSA
jgi:hypothetical protein